MVINCAFYIWSWFSLRRSQLYHMAFISTAITITFDQSTYRVDEDDGPAQPVLVLSNPSSTDIAVQVFSTDGSAAGEYYTYKFSDGIKIMLLTCYRRRC